MTPHTQFQSEPELTDLNVDSRRFEMGGVAANWTPYVG